MTPLSKEILEHYQVRKTKKQKDAFIERIQKHFPEATIQTGGFPKCRNIIIGNIETAKVILTAHYDTCARLPLPNFIAPKRPLLSILYSLVLAAPFVAVMFLAEFLSALFIESFYLHYFLNLAVYFGVLSLLIAGPANRHNANDNTSGVITLTELLTVLEPGMRSQVAFVFFDHEETGLIGSSFFRSQYKKVMREKLLINFDCVSDGDNILVSASKKARAEYAQLLKNSFLPEDNKAILFEQAEKIYFPSDQAGFKTAVAVAALKHKNHLGYYMDKIHTAKDTEFDPKNIKLICQSILRLLQNLQKQKASS